MLKCLWVDWQPMLERTPAVFQALPVTARLAGVLQDLASAGDVLAESLDLSITDTLRRPAGADVSTDR